MLFWLPLVCIFTGSSVNSSKTKKCHKCHIYYSLVHHIYPWAHSVSVLHGRVVSFTGLQFSGIPLRPFRKLIANKPTLCIPVVGADSRAGYIPHNPQSVVRLFHPSVLQDSWVKVLSSNLYLWAFSSTSLEVTMGFFFGQWEAGIIKKSKKVLEVEENQIWQTGVGFSAESSY